MQVKTQFVLSYKMLNFTIWWSCIRNMIEWRRIQFMFKTWYAFTLCLIARKHILSIFMFPKWTLLWLSLWLYKTFQQLRFTMTATWNTTIYPWALELSPKSNLNRPNIKKLKLSHCNFQFLTNYKQFPQRMYYDAQF